MLDMIGLEKKWLAKYGVDADSIAALVGHPDVTLYEMQGYDHGAMPHPAYHILKQHIKRLTTPRE